MIFSTKNRQPLITDDIEDRLYGVIGGTLRTGGGVLLAANGVADHVHLLISMPRDLSVSEIVRNVKTASSKWMHEELKRMEFAWQSGYAAFSVSFSGLDAVRRYMANQKVHHRTQSFQDEVRAFLRVHEIEPDEAHMWE